MNSSTFGRALPKRYDAEKKSVRIASMIPAKSLMRWLIGNILYDVVKNMLISFKYAVRSELISLFTIVLLLEAF